jgi:hypothetical protein
MPGQRARPSRAAPRSSRAAPRSSQAAPRSTRRPDRDEDFDAPESQRPYGSWYPLVRVGHFLLMATSSCLIIMVGLGVLGMLIYLFVTLTK